MKLSLPVALLTTLLVAADAAAGVDMNDPRRAVGREDDIRVDAQIPDENVRPGVPISVTYQIQNFTTEAIAVAPKVASASYDPDEQTITVGIGSEVPDGGIVPALVAIGPGETKSFTVAAPARFVLGNLRSKLTRLPRYVRVKVNVLRDIAPFRNFIGTERPAAARKIDDALFDQWLESNETIFLSSVPVRVAPPRSMGGGAEARSIEDSF